MGWLDKFFKGSSHTISEGQYQDRHDDRVFSGPSALRDSSNHGNEDIDRAIALSLSEEEQKKDKIVGTKSRLKEDEQLAKALQESLNSDSSACKSGQVARNYQRLSCIFPARVRICAGCNKDVGISRFLSSMGSVWHPECFCCHHCNKPITESEFSMSGKYLYHRSCYKERYHPKCDCCNQFIPTNLNGLIEYRSHPFWLQKFCPSHELDGTPRCCSCERMEVRDARYVTLDDGRKLCLECLDSAIMDTNECQPLYLDIQEFYEGLNMKIEQQVPLLLVERQALNEAMEGDKNGYHHLPETRGLCLSEERTVSTILQRPKFGAGNRIMKMRTEPYRLARQCEVTAILLLYGLPRLLTGCILSHEMMHAWLRLKGYSNLRQNIEEGICQVLAHMWLDSELTSGLGGVGGSGGGPTSSSSASSSSSSSVPPPSKKSVRSRFERELGEFFKHQIESDTSTAYGDGFRAANRAVVKYGLKRTLDHIKMTGRFP